MLINVTYDSSAAGAPAGFQQAVQAAVQFYEATIATNITVNITFGWGQLNGQTLSASAIGENETGGYLLSYQKLRQALDGTAGSLDDQTAIKGLPASNPTSGGSFFVSSAQAKALGLIPAANATNDGYVSLASQDSFTFDPNNRAVAGEYDAIGVLEHEISEVLGRDSFLGDPQQNGQQIYSAMDLFRYSAAGVLAPSSNVGSFSVDGQHLLLPFNDPTNGGDAGDWSQAVSGDSYDAFGQPGVAETVSATDVRLMDVLGYNLARPMPTTPTPNLTPANATIVVAQTYQVAQGQTVYFLTTDPGSSDIPAFQLGSSSGSSGLFTNAGTIIAYSTSAQNFLVETVLGFNTAMSFTNTATGSVYVEANGIGDSVYDLKALPNVDNAGLLQAVSTNGQATAYVSLGSYDLSVSFTNEATGLLTVWASGSAIGADFTLFGSFSNAGVIDVSGGQAIGVRGATSFTNSGTISATNIDGSPSVGVALYSAGYPQQVGTFYNSGTIQADYAFFNNQNYSYSSNITIINTGYIIGSIAVGSSDTVIHNTSIISNNIFFGNGVNNYDGSGGHLYGSIYLSLGQDNINLGADPGFVYGGGGTGTINGGAGNDFFEVTRGAYTINGGAGFNILSFADADTGVTVDLGAGTAFAGGVDSISNIQEVIGGRYSDTLKAGSAAAVLVAGSGHTILIGGAGGDTLVAGAGGGVMTGGGGNNTFVYSSGDHQWAVNDFAENGDQDTLQVYGYSGAQSIVQQGSDVLVTLSATDTILLKNVLVADLNATRLVFHANPYAGPDVPFAGPTFGDSTISLDQNLTVYAGETLQETADPLGFLAPAHALDNFGAISVVFSQAATALDPVNPIYGYAYSNFTKNGQQLTATTLVTNTNEAGATFIVNNPIGAATGFLVSDGSLVNNGHISISAATHAEGLKTSSAYFSFMNSATGVFSVTGHDFVTGLQLTNGGWIENDGLFNVAGTGTGAVYGIQTGLGSHVIEPFLFQGAWITGEGDHIINAGTLSVSAGPGEQAYGIAVSGISGIGIDNSGTITAATAITALGGGFSPAIEPRILVNNTGTINGSISLGGSGSVTNSGIINGDITLGEVSPSLQSYGGGTVQNSGTITGNITLSDGSNTIDLRNGVFHGSIEISPTQAGQTAQDVIYMAAAGGLVDIHAGNTALTVSIVGAAQGATTVQFDEASTAATITHNANGTWTVAAGADGTETLTNVQYLAFTDRTITLNTLANTNHPPTLAAAASETLAANATANLSSWITYADADSDPAVSYRLYDDGGNSGYFSYTGNSHLAAGQTVEISAATLASVVVHGGSSAGSQTLWVRPYDGKDWGAWTTITLNTLANTNHPPTLAAAASETLAANATANLSSWITYADAYSDPAVSYRLYDDGGNSGYFSYTGNNHLAAAQTVEISAATLASVVVHGGSSAGTQTLWVRPYDGKDWGAWTTITLNTLANTNHPPTLTAASSETLAANATANLSSWITYADADNDPAVSYRLYDDGGNSGYFSFTGNSHMAAAQSVDISAATLASVVVHGGSSAGSQTLWVRPYDGKDWGAWTSFTLTTTAGQGPVIAGADQTLATGTETSLLSIINASEPGNSNLFYDIDDLTPVGLQGHFSSTVNPGYYNEITATAAQMQNETYIAGSTADTISVTVWDGGGDHLGLSTTKIIHLLI